MPVDISTQVWKKQRLMYPIEVVEQPRSLGTPFVKDTDLPSSSSYIVGEKSTTEKTTHPSLLLMNYQGPATLVWYLVADDVIYPHPYVLEGVDCQDGVCTKTILAKGQIISFPGLYVRSVSKEDIQKTLERRLDILKERLPGTGFKLKDPTEYNLSSVRICFHVKFPDANRCQEMLSLVTKSLHSKEPPLQREPRILSVSQCKGSVLGREELTLRVTNLKTDDVFVFFHCESTAPRSSWQAFAEVISISRQKATPVDIVVKTPPYPDQQISEPQRVAIQIRLLDNSLSNTMKYTYIPEPKGVTRSEQKVKLREPIYVRYFTCLGASASINPVLKMTHEEKGAGSSRAIGLDRMHVYKHKDSRAVKKAKPNKVNAGSQTEERYLRPGGLGEGYDSEEELGVSDDRVDYNRLERYRSLMMGSESPPHAPSTNDTETRPQLMDFSPRAVLGSLQSSKSNQSNSSDSTLHQVGFRSSSPYNSSNVKSENLVTDVSLVNLQSKSPHGGEGFSSAVSKKDTVKDLQRSLDQDVKDEPENSPSNNTETVDSSAASTTHGIFGRHQCEFSIEGTLQVIEIVLRSPEASDLPDLVGSNLYPAIVDKAEFPVNVNKAGLVAVKTIDASLFQEEAYSIWFRLEHRSLITIFGIIKQEARRCLILEFPEEGCLERYLSKTDPGKWWKWIVQAAEALQHLHKNGLAHQEITVENCLISADGNLLLNIPTNLIASKNFLEEGIAVVDEEFKRAKAGDVLSFSVLAQIWLKNCSLPENVAKSFESYFDVCRREDESHRPTIQEIVKKLQSAKQNQSETPGKSAVPPLKVVPPSPQHDADQSDANEFTGLRSCIMGSIPNYPDSGVGTTSGSTRSGLTFSSEPEGTDSETSHESATSFSSRKNKNSLSTLSAESITQGHMEAEAANLTNSREGNKPSGEESPPMETQESAITSDDDNTEILEERSEGGQGGSDRHEEGHEQNGRDEEGSKSHLRPPKVTKRIDHTGGRLELFNGEISLEIPPGALPEDQVKDITLSVDWNDKHVPPLRLSDMNVAPVVQCGPTGLQFDKPVQLKLPHCAVIPDNKRCKMTVHCSETEEGESPHWQRISKPEDSDMAVDCQDGCFILSVHHFCLFTVSVNGEEFQAKNIMIVGYGPKLRSLEDDQEIRIYLYDDHVSSRNKIHLEEQNLDGKQLDGPVTYQLHDVHQGSMSIEVKFHTRSWLLTSSSSSVEFSFSKMWNSQPYNRCKFTFNNSTNTATQFRCDIEFQQKGNEDVAKLEISNHVKLQVSSDPTYQPTGSSANDNTTFQVSSDSSYLPTGSGANWYSFDAPAPPQRAPGFALLRQRQISRRDVSFQGSTDSGLLESFQKRSSSSLLLHDYADGLIGPSIMPGSYGSYPEEIIPYAVERLLCEKLDVIDNALGSDWRLLAASFGYDRWIRSWGNQPSPTRCILQAVLQEKRIKSLNDLKDKLQAMNRLDVVEDIETYELSTCDRSTPSKQPASEEPMALGDTPSPDDTVNPLAGGQGFLQALPQPLQVPDQSCPTNGSLSSTDAVPGDSNPNMVGPACNGTAMTGHMLSNAQPQHHASDHESLHSTETGINNCPQTPSPATSQNQPVTNPMASPDSPMNTSGSMTPWKLAPSSGTTDENRNVEAVTQGVRRMLWESGESNGC